MATWSLENVPLSVWGEGLPSTWHCFGELLGHGPSYPGRKEWSCTAGILCRGAVARLEHGHSIPEVSTDVSGKVLQQHALLFPGNLRDAQKMQPSSAGASQVRHSSSIGTPK